MAKSTTRIQQGLSNNANHTALPNGTLTEAVNAAYTSQGAIRPRPGFYGLTIDDAGLDAQDKWVAAITDFDGYIVAIMQNGGVSEVEAPDPEEEITYYYSISLEDA